MTQEAFGARAVLSRSDTISAVVRDDTFSRTDALLALRVAATIAVVLGHAASFFNGLGFTQPPVIPPMQSAAVVIFFAVSGWTIAWIIDTRSSYTFTKFTFDRFSRLTIPLIPVLIGYGLLEWWLAGDSHPYGDALNFLSAVQNILMLQDMALRVPGIGLFDTGATSFGFNRPLWTLSIEFWTYVAFGGFALVLLRRTALTRAKAVASVLVAMFAVLLLGDSIFAGRGHGLPMIWLLGALLYFAQRQVPDLSNRSRLALLPLWVLAASFLFDRDVMTPVGGMTAAYNLAIFANFALFVLIAPGLRIHRHVVRVITFLGSFAYTAYLVHYPFMSLIREHVGTGSAVAVLASITAFGLAWIASLPFEQRYRSIRDWIWSRATRADEKLS